MALKIETITCSATGGRDLSDWVEIPSVSGDFLFLRLFIARLTSGRVVYSVLLDMGFAWSIKLSISSISTSLLLSL